MLLSEARQLAIDLMGDYIELSDWIFEFDRAKNRFGRCSYKRKTISLSKHLVALNTRAEVEDTILHEIAHALVGPGNGHNYKWRAKCREVGARPERCYDSSTVDTVEYNWIGTCDEHGLVAQRHRLKEAAKLMACGKCCKAYNNGDYSPDYIVTWTDNRKPANKKHFVEFVDSLPA